MKQVVNRKHMLYLVPCRKSHEKKFNVDVVIEATGVSKNVIEAKKVIKSGISKVVITHSPKNVDFTMILGVNEKNITLKNIIL